ncbi:hypothetical protein [Mesorhizobium sp. CAU 1732]|uniref:hypothetical protein n=1 Tax=Mesorhizobium sp. CAU 1732 TaxID=3140358 RepID=UPI0032617DD0
MARFFRVAAALAVGSLVSACQFYGGGTVARLDGATLNTSSTGASVGTSGVSTQSTRTVTHLPVRY